MHEKSLLRVIATTTIDLMTGISEQFSRLAGSRLLKNIGANYIGAVLNTALPLITLPIYLNHLGAENWGLVSFVAFFVSALSILDAGFNQALVKEFARVNVKKLTLNERNNNLLFGYERLYIGFALIIIFSVFPFTDQIVTHWLDLGSLPHNSGLLTLYCACAMFLFQFPSSIYRTVLVAGQEQVLLNKILSCVVVVRHATSVLLVFYSHAIWVYLIWQVFCSATETIWLSRVAWIEVGVSRKQSHWDRAAMASTIRFALMMAISALLGAATAMVDKFYITGKLPIAQLGYYGIASSVSFGVLRLSYPVFTALLPRLVQLQSDAKFLLKINLRLILIIVSGLALGAVIFMLIGSEVLQFWLKNKTVADSVYPVLSLLLISSALNVLYNLGYTNWIAAGASKIILTINLVSFIFAIVITPIAIDRFGLFGAASALVIMNSIGAVTSLIWLAKCTIRRHSAS